MKAVVGFCIFLDNIYLSFNQFFLKAVSTKKEGVGLDLEKR
jgi:hypothetical protein